MVFPVHLQRSAVVAIRDCPDRNQFIGSLSLKQAALQWIWIFQESLLKLVHGSPVAMKNMTGDWRIQVLTKVELKS
jgi:hypothetical protein